ncbi:MAG TPA: hypothetical protein VGL77_09430, partial [Armatimonadota bacterium]
MFQQILMTHGRTALLCGALLVLGLGWGQTPGHAAVVEDWTTLANGTTDSNKNGYLDLGDDGAKTDDWLCRQISAYQLETLPGAKEPVLTLKPASGPPTWHAAGKAHKQTLTGVTTIDLTIPIAGRTAYVSGEVWLSDDLQNGYGFIYSRGNYNAASIFKLRGCTVGFDANATSDWTAQYGERPKDLISIGLQNNDFITMHLRLEQVGAGKPVTATLWYTGSTKEFPDTSYEKPAQQL